MKYSIRFKLYSGFIGILLFFVIALFLISNLALDNIIIYANKTIIENVYDQYNNQFEEYSIDDQLLARISNQYNIGIVVYENKKIVNCSYSFLCIEDNNKLPEYVSKYLYQVQIGEYDYHFLKYKLLNVNQLVYLYNVDDDRYIIISKSLNSITELNNLIRPFIALTSLVILIVGSITIYILSKRLTDPILKISMYAEDIANQKFDRKLDRYTNDELGQLTDNMNKLSDQLSKALSKLKSDLDREKELDKQRIKFFSTISHELKTPLTIIQGYADGLRHNIVKDKKGILEYSEIIMGETKKMSRLINDLLNLSLYESGKFKLNKEYFDIKQLIVNKAYTYIESIKDKDIDLEINAANDHYLVFGDQYRLEQVISNLITNAVKYVDDNGFIKISLFEDEKYTIIQFYNNGEQIHENDINNIWNSFYKVEGTKNYIGTGLGLALVRSIIELHNGKYGVVNKNIGVEFFISIPK